MVNLRSFEVPTIVKHAPGAVECLADEVKALGVKRPMLVTDGGLVKAGIAERVTDVLKAGNVDYYLFDGVIANPPIRLVNEAGMRVPRRGLRRSDRPRWRQPDGHREGDRRGGEERRLDPGV